MSAPSGAQVELRRGAQRAVAVEVGAGLREYEVGGRALLDGYPVERMADGGRGQALLPWPNRLADGAYEFDGAHLQLPIDEVERHNAIHGLTRWLNWTIAEQSAERVRMRLVLHPRPGYPFTLELSIEYVLSTEGLTVTTTATNVGTEPLPFAGGHHPYFTAGTPTIDAAVLQVPAHHMLELDADRRLPTGMRLPIEGTEVDFRVARPIGRTIIDTCYTLLDRDGDGRVRVKLGDAERVHGLSVWLDESYPYVQVFSGDTLAPARRRRGLAIEPMTSPPNAFRSGEDLVVIEPQQVHTATWGVAPE